LIQFHPPNTIKGLQKNQALAFDSASAGAGVTPPVVGLKEETK